LVIFLAPDILVEYGRGGRLRGIAPKGLLVESFFQDGLHVLVGVRLNKESSGTGGL